MVELNLKRLIVVCAAFLAVLLASCVPMDSPLYQEQQYAQMTLETGRQYMTATAAQDEAHTEATREAVHVTATAEAAQLERDRLRATQAAQEIYLRATQAAWNLESTAQSAQVIAYQTQQANMAERDRLGLMRQQEINKVQALAPWGILLTGLVALMYSATAWAIAYSRRPQVIHRDARGYAPILRDVRTNSYYDADRNPGPLMLASPRYGAQVVTSADPAQTDVTRRAQAIHLVHDGLEGTAPTKALPKTLEPAASALPAPEISVSPVLPDSADWGHMLTWPGKALCLGAGASAPVMLDTEDRPHLLYAGTSGSGKSRGGLRPLVAELLARSCVTVIIDRSGLDFIPFVDHKNARVLTLDKPEAAIDYLRRAYDEILRRFEVLRQAGESTWSRLPSPPDPEVWIVMDEFSNLADSMTSENREELWRYARMIAAEGRKAGIHLAIALQDPTYRSLDLRIRRNMTSVCFAVKDQDASRVVLGVGGAEKLPHGQFMVVNGEPVTGVAFNPNDNEIASFLARRDVPALPAPAWLDADTKAAEQPRAENTDERIRALHAQGKSMSDIEREVYGYTGGKAYQSVRRVLLLQQDDPRPLVGAVAAS